MSDQAIPRFRRLLWLPASAVALHLLLIAGRSPYVCRESGQEGVRVFVLWLAGVLAGAAVVRLALGWQTLVAPWQRLAAVALAVAPALSFWALWAAEWNLRVQDCP